MKESIDCEWKEYQIKLNEIRDKLVSKLYSNFNFLYISPSFFNDNENNLNNSTQKDRKIDFFIEHLACFKFITFEYSDDLQHAKNFNLVICVEKECFVIKRITL